MVVEGSANKQIRGGKPRKSWSGLAWSAAIKFNARRPSRRTTFDPSSYGNSIHCFALVSLASRRRLERSFHGYDGWSKSNFLFNLDENEDRLTRGTGTNDRKVDSFSRVNFQGREGDVVCFAIAMSPRHGSMGLNANLYGAKSRDLTGTGFVCLFAFTALFVYVSLLFAFVPGAYVSTHRVFPTPNSLTFVLETIRFLIEIRHFDKYLTWEDF